MKGKKVCKKCMVFVEHNKCPFCGGNQFVENWKGRLIVIKPEQSEISKKLNIKKKGTYAIKIT